MNYTILQGDALQVLRTLPDNHVQCCVTSPPYWGLRDYGTGKWEGGREDCSHRRDSKVSAAGETGSDNVQGGIGDAIYKDVCLKCGAIRIDNQLGLEKTPEEYVSKMVEVFREVRRVLRDDGVCFLNLGDSYYNYRPGCEAQPKQSLAKHTGAVVEESGKRGLKQVGLKEKDLCGIPWRVAFALQADGWYLRQDIVWHKPNPMPESVKDRCTKAHEYIFLLTKSARYYYDWKAIAEKVGEPTRRAATFRNGGDYTEGNSFNNSQKKEKDSHGDGDESLDGRNARSVWTMATQSYEGAHFATFPESLPEKCIEAGSKIGDVVLDPFCGSGTTGAVAIRYGRKFIGIELNPEYIKLAEKRIQEKELPMFAEV